MLIWRKHYAGSMPYREGGKNWYQGKDVWGICLLSKCKMNYKKVRVYGHIGNHYKN